MSNAYIYEDIARRTNGNIYIGVVGPVRTGKSTFIKRFMDLMVVPNVENSYSKARIVDELPQSGDGKTIYTTEPKFIPNEPVRVRTSDNLAFNVKMVDCVGYIIPGVSGHLEDGKERMVKTPWDDETIPFSQAAEMGTDKVINDHATVAIVVTTDGSIGEIPSSAYREAEEKTITQLKHLKKPFIVIVNSIRPASSEAQGLAREIETKFGVPTVAENCAKLNEKDIGFALEKLLGQFPASEINFKLPGYLEALDKNHWIKKSIIESIKGWMESFDTIGTISDTLTMLGENQLINDISIETLDMGTGIITVSVDLDSQLYYRVIEEIMGNTIENDGQLFMLLKEFSTAKKAYDNLSSALDQVDRVGYGIVQPKLEEMELKEPEIFKQGNKYGVRMTAKAPCLHIIKTDITTEVSPVVGSESQSQDLIAYLNTQFGEDKAKVWSTNLFGKSIQEMVTEQMDNKLSNVPEAIRGKVQKSLQKISDEGKDYFICIIL